MKNNTNDIFEEKSFNGFLTDSESSTPSVETKTVLDHNELDKLVESDRNEIEQLEQQLVQKKMILIDKCRLAVQYYFDEMSKAHRLIKRYKDTYLKLCRLIEVKDKSNESLNAKLEKLQESYNEVKYQNEELEMKLNEMNKLSSRMAKKASEEALLEAIRTYADSSKTKKYDKRVFAKTVIMELVIGNGLKLPPNVAETINHLDDEQPDTKMVVNVAGNLNDIHDNTTVNQK